MLRDDVNQGITLNNQNLGFHIKPPVEQLGGSKAPITTLGFANIWREQDIASHSIDTKSTRIDRSGTLFDNHIS